MQFKAVFLMALLTAITSVTAVPTEKIPCDNAYHPCNQAEKYEDCSPEYIELIKQCEESQCIAWFRDPLEHCYDTA